jgi:tetratricopeptide (TPR) repeat protein
MVASPPPRRRRLALAALPLALLAVLAAGHRTSSVSGLENVTWLERLWPAPALAEASASDLPPGDPTEQFSAANRLYEEGHFAEAAAVYRTQAERGLESPALFFNLGNALLKAGELGEAIVYYERARALAPRAEDIRTNLLYARSLSTDVLPEVEGSQFLSALAGLKDSISAEEALTVSQILLWLLAIAAAVWRLAANRRQLTRGLVTACLVAFALSAALAAIKVHEATGRERAVVVIPEVPVRSGPGDTYTARFTLHEGTTVEVERRASDWCEVRLAETMGGWVPCSALLGLYSIDGS